jgi:hypothetical protein
MGGGWWWVRIVVGIPEKNFSFCVKKFFKLR